MGDAAGASGDLVPDDVPILSNTLQAHSSLARIGQVMARTMPVLGPPLVSGRLRPRGMEPPSGHG